MRLSGRSRVLEVFSVLMKNRHSVGGYFFPALGISCEGTDYSSKYVHIYIHDILIPSLSKSI